MPNPSTILECTQRCKKLDEECRESGKPAQHCDQQRLRCEDVCPYL